MELFTCSALGHLKSATICGERQNPVRCFRGLTQNVVRIYRFYTALSLTRSHTYRECLCMVQATPLADAMLLRDVASHTGYTDLCCTVTPLLCARNQSTLDACLAVPKKVAWGMHCLCSALKFLHEDCKLYHNNISTDSVFVTRYVRKNRR